MIVSNLLGLSIEDFNRAYREKKLFLNKGNREEPQLGNLDWDNRMKDYFERKDLTYPFVRLVREGKILVEESYTYKNRGFFKLNLIDKAKLIRHFDDGATIIVTQAQLQISAIGNLCASIASEIECEVQANIYITPTNSHGFYPHIDTHDVMVLQLTGEKQWDIYDYPIKYPIGSTNLTEKEGQAYLKKTPSSQLCLHKGDVLFIPRGIAHRAFTRDSISIHATIGLLPFTVAEMLSVYAQRGKIYEVLRKTVSKANISEVTDELSRDLIESGISASQDLGYGEQIKYSGDFYGSLLRISDGVKNNDSFKVIAKDFDTIHFENCIYLSLIRNCNSLILRLFTGNRNI